jgi:MFS family permease
MSDAESGPVHSGGMFRSLRHRNYRLFFMGQSISLIGNWLQWAAMNWLIYELTRSAFWLGAVGFCRISIMFVAPFAGILADRMDRRQLIVVTQVMATIQPAMLAVLTLTGWINPYWIVALSIYAGIIAAFDIPIRQAFTVEMIDDRADLGNAIALNSTMVNGARLIGPAMAGVLIKLVGEGWCFFLNALSYLPVIWALLAMEIPVRRSGQTKHVLRELGDGVRYAFGFAPIRSVLLLLCLVSIAGMPYQQFMSAFAQDVLHVGPGMFGLLTSCVAIGAIIGAGYLASRRRAAGLEAVIPAATFIFGVGLVLFSQSRDWWTAMPLLAVAGFGMMVQMASSNTVLQTICDEDKRGRVMSFYTMAFMGTVPLGQLLAGNVASWLGPTTAVSLPRTLLLSGIVCIAGAAVFASNLTAFRRRVLPIYQRLGLMPSGPGDPGIGVTPAPGAAVTGAPPAPVGVGGGPPTVPAGGVE